MNPLSEVFGEIKDSLSGVFDDEVEKHVLVVAKPFCTPARYIITSAFQKYGIKIYKYKEGVKTLAIKDFLRRMDIEMRDGENMQYGPFSFPGFMSMAQIAHVTVSKKQAGWAEYIALRTRQLYIPGKYVNPRNHEWAVRHGGVMPPAWKEGKPWVEKSCSQGAKELQYLKQVTKPVKK